VRWVSYCRTSYKSQRLLDSNSRRTGAGRHGRGSERFGLRYRETNGILSQDSTLGTHNRYVSTESFAARIFAEYSCGKENRHKKPAGFGRLGAAQATNACSQDTTAYFARAGAVCRTSASCPNHSS
jgi:hypothetical protein